MTYCLELASLYFAANNQAQICILNFDIFLFPSFYLILFSTYIRLDLCQPRLNRSIVYKLAITNVLQHRPLFTSRNLVSKYNSHNTLQIDEKSSPSLSPVFKTRPHYLHRNRGCKIRQCQTLTSIGARPQRKLHKIIPVYTQIPMNR